MKSFKEYSGGSNTHTPTDMKIFLFASSGSKETHLVNPLSHQNLTVKSQCKQGHRVRVTAHALNPLLNPLFSLQLWILALIELHAKGGTSGSYMKDIASELVTQSFTLSHETLMDFCFEDCCCVIRK